MATKSAIFVGLVLFGAFVYAQQPIKIPRTDFTCQGRPSGYYADVETGCQIYHMCDGLGRQFSYACPNTTLFQQRMLVCDHWYMVNCSRSEDSYYANLLIGQRDKPFVSEQENQHRTPRPDILSVPYSNKYYDGLKQAETKYVHHPSNSIVGIADTIKSSGNQDLESSKTQYTVPTHWSMQLKKYQNLTRDNEVKDRKLVINQQSIALQIPQPHDSDNTFDVITETKRFIPRTEQPQIIQQEQNNHSIDPNSSNNILNPESHIIFPPTININTETSNTESYNVNQQFTDASVSLSTYQRDLKLDINNRSKLGSSKGNSDHVVNFINRFDPNAKGPTTAMTTAEILSINHQLPPGPSASDENVDGSEMDTSNSSATVKPVLTTEKSTSSDSKVKHNKDGNKIPVPSKLFQPPKYEYSAVPSTTMGPPIYYEWKWAAPAFDLEPPKEDSEKTSQVAKISQAISKNMGANKPEHDTKEANSQNTQISRSVKTNNPKNINDYKIGSYFIPNFEFPLDKPHPGYEELGAKTSFLVQVPNVGDDDVKMPNYGENPKCPQCHPAYTIPGTCKPCIMVRR